MTTLWRTSSADFRINSTSAKAQHFGTYALL
nr:MAG TPA: hypothetical protein [Caudoviricetes sp.]